jgi:hypothetical protein
LVCIEDTEVRNGRTGVASAFYKSDVLEMGMEMNRNCNAPAIEADSSIWSREGMLFHSEKLSLSSSISFSSVLISLDIRTNSA